MGYLVLALVLIAIVSLALLLSLLVAAPRTTPSQTTSSSTSSDTAPIVTSTATVTSTSTSVSTETSTVVSTSTETTTIAPSTVTTTSTSTVTSTVTTTVLPPPLTQTSSGLEAYDPLTSGNTSRWSFYAGAQSQGMKSAHMENSSGLFLGAEASPSSTSSSSPYSGLYAGISVNAQVFNAIVSIPVNETSGYSQFNAGLYVQTGGPYLDYVSCVGVADSTGYFWVIEVATTPSSSPNLHAQTIAPLWREYDREQPLKRDCTIVTNDQNLLRAYLDGTLVYSNSTMHLGYQYPLSARLEVQTTSSSKMVYGRFTDFYAASSENVTIGGLPAGATARLVGPSGSVYASAVSGPSGSVLLPVASYAMPLVTFIVVEDGDSIVASTSAPSGVWGGDVYSVPAAS